MLVKHSNTFWACRCEALSDSAYKDDVLILAGDISDDQAVLRSTFQLMVRKFKHVFFVPGNHDLWVRRKERDLLDSLGNKLKPLSLAQQSEHLLT